MLLWLRSIVLREENSQSFAWALQVHRLMEDIDVLIFIISDRVQPYIYGLQTKLFESRNK